MTRQALADLSIRAAGIGTYVLHLPAQTLEVDDRLLELAELTRATFTGRPGDVYANVHPDDVDDVIARVEQAVATSGSYAAEYRIALPAGGHRWVAAHGEVLTDDTGAATALVGAAYDVTAAREATARTATVLETMAVGYLSMDAAWAITYVNAAAEQIAQAPRADLVGRSFWDAFPAAVGTDFERGYRRAMATGDSVTFEAFYPTPLDVWVEVRAVPENTGLTLYFLDITDRHHAQDVAERASAQASALGGVALALAEAEDLEDLVATMAEQGMPALGADGGAVSVLDPADPSSLLSYVTISLGEAARGQYARMSLSEAMPTPWAAATGQRVLLGDERELTELFPAVLPAVESTGCQAWACLPLRAGEKVIGVLSAGWVEPQTFPPERVVLLETYAAQCAQALRRLQARDAERRAAEAERRAGELARTAAERQATLVAIAQALADADTQDEVLAVLGGRGTSLLGANGCGLCLREADGTHVISLVSDTYAQVRTTVQRVPADFPLPAIRSAVTGASIYLEDRARAEAAFPGAGAVYEGAGVQASAAVPLHGRGQLLGCLSVGFAEARTWTQPEQDLLRAFAAMTTQALDRIAAHEAEEAALAAASGIAETLQRSMLTPPPEPDHLQIAVRYAATAKTAEVGGDWYDSFVTSGGLTSVVIGDVTGHDMAAAAVMGQLRNLVRGIAFTLGEPPASVLAAVDRAAAGLGIDTVATAILAQVEQNEAHRAAGTRLLRWSNAGHLPPLLIEADGTARFLEPPPDLVLGWDPAIDRHDHEVVLEPGATVLLYTDGLIERRGAHLERGLAWLAEAAAELVASPGVTLEDLCDALVELVGDHLDDDVALLALRAHPEDEPRPVEAGPSHVPARLDQALEAAEQADAS